MQIHFPRRRTHGRTDDASDARHCRRLREQLCEPVAAAAGHGATIADVADVADVAHGADAAHDADVAARHLASCPDCAAFARRLELARQALAGPRSAPAIEPDPYFPARVLARIERPAELIGWAAFRALPAALGLALALAWLGLSMPASPPPTPPASPLLDEPPSSEQLLAWSSLSPEVWP
ncbi:MAG TPA: hypothetical protein VN999_07520 [Thermoanaerobaculia bacterium]|nr:hypothetical protein [Thermoanaerobaculia bacterium]